MKFFPADKMGFFDTVQAYFLELTGKGLVLSARDVELLFRWRSRGASAAVVCRGIDRAVSALDGPPRSIWACRRYVEPLVEEARGLVAGSHDDSSSAGESAPDEPGDLAENLGEEALEKIEAAGKSCQRESLREVYRNAWKRVHDLLEDGDEDVFSELLAVDEALMEGFFQALEREEQQRIRERIESAHTDQLTRMSPAAREQHLEAQRRRVLREEFDLVTLLE